MRHVIVSMLHIIADVNVFRGNILGWSRYNRLLQFIHGLRQL